MNTKIIVIVGPTSTGKTELAKALQESLLPKVWLHFSVDSLIYSLPDSVLAICNNDDDWAGVDGPLLFRSAISCLRTLALEGNSVIFDLVIPNEKKTKELDETLAGLDALIVELTCDWEEIKKRTIGRGDRTITEAERSFNTKFKTLRVDVTFDTTRASPSEISDQVRSLLRDKIGEQYSAGNVG